MQTDAPFDTINFGSVPEPIDDLLQAGVRARRTDKAQAEGLFRQAVEMDPTVLASYFCLYKIHTYSGDFDAARAIAEAGLAEAARQAGWPTDWTLWVPRPTGPEDPGRFALYTLKALAFIALRDQRPKDADAMLAALRKLDPLGDVGWAVISDLATGSAA